jgi:hypothetical protein
MLKFLLGFATRRADPLSGTTCSPSGVSDHLKTYFSEHPPRLDR